MLKVGKRVSERHPLREGVVRKVLPNAVLVQWDGETDCEIVRPDILTELT